MKEPFKKIGARKMALAVIGLTLGVVLMLAGNFGGLGESDTESVSEAATVEAYRQETEARLRALCSSVRGAGEVRVMVTLSGGYEYVYARDGDGDCVTVGSGSSERAVVEEVCAPRIVGVGVVCAGAEDPLVRQQLVELVCSSLNVAANRIVVTAGK